MKKPRELRIPRASNIFLLVCKNHDPDRIDPTEENFIMQSNMANGKSLFGFRDTYVSLHCTNRALGLSHHTTAEFYTAKGLDVVRVGRTSYLKKADVIKLLEQSTTPGKIQPKPCPRVPRNPRAESPLTAEEIAKCSFHVTPEGCKMLAERQVIFGEDDLDSGRYKSVCFVSGGQADFSEAIHRGYVFIKSRNKA